MKTRHQKGYVYRKGNWWYVRFYDDMVQADGSIERVQVARKLARYSDYRSKRSVVPLVEEVLQPINSGLYRPESTATLEQFVEQTYLPYVQAQKRPSTYKGYRNTWEVHLKVRCGAIRLREFRTCDGEQLLAEIARQNNLTRNTVKRIKSLLSGIFKHAKRLGVLDGVNPMQDVSISRGRDSDDTYAYSLEEVMQMLAVLPEPAATVIATAAFTGMRKGELSGLLWENYNGTQIWVTQSVWEGHVTEPKTRQSKAAVPVIEPLRKMLDRNRRVQGSPERGLVFVSRNGTPLNLNNLVNRHIKPALRKAELGWHGWHAFRRGLATNLYRLGVADKTVQAILRHSDVSITMAHYVKPVQEDVTKAMQTLEEMVSSQPAVVQ